MVEKPTSGDEEQRRAQTRAARRQSGLPPETESQDVDGGSDRDHEASDHEASDHEASDNEASDSTGSGDAGANPAPEEDR